MDEIKLQNESSNVSEQLTGYIKIISANIKMLHRHLVGGNWFGDHEQLGKYYDEIDEIEDSIIEIAISLGESDMPINIASEKYKVLSARDYSAAEAYSLVKIYFEKLQNLLSNFKDSIPNLSDGIKSKIDEYLFYLNFESNFKLSGFLKGASADSIDLDEIRTEI